ncbi:hypothetical protein SMSP2_01673 [Limihaloglobus sulfuriphilus]|uniref:Uncharacterized protein n=1 Tax=Limihaloglobus sulfuriphilus TaxID=1851148 RepID=A0A1Q2MGA0_9BACT|nr:hypothetical protein [Limihaloglobus sulfuriphilus]AQQ71302.1 hypothetical protein SMSP2_01673 [Limihaloglobus sulfuriphilus]
MKKLSLILAPIVALTFFVAISYAEGSKKGCGGESACKDAVRAKCAQSCPAADTCKPKDGKSCSEAAACKPKDGAKCGDACKEAAAKACTDGCKHADQEIRKHETRRSKIKQLKALASEIGDEKLIARLEELSTKEASRHNKAMKACSENGCQAAKAKSCSDKAKGCGTEACKDKPAQKKCCGSDACKK